MIGTRVTVFANGFTLKRASVWQTGSFNASPEPVRKGQAVTAKFSGLPALTFTMV